MLRRSCGGVPKPLPIRTTRESKHPLSESDSAYLRHKEDEFREQVRVQITPDEDNSGGIIQESDRLRFAILFLSDDVKAAYLRAYRVLDGGPRGELSARLSDSRELEWFEILVKLFNDEQQVAITCPCPTLRAGHRVPP